MTKIPQDYVERVYAGWLGKLIGVRHGAPVESWTNERIRMAYGKITDYLVDYRDFAADDDSNGPAFFLRALEDYVYTEEITPEQIGLTWLNYAPYEHGFYWWGGYGRSTEHTAYLNLRNGIMAPDSGSERQNGAAVAEQIGGQIFIDTWGLAVPGDYEKAARYAAKAASVSHDGNGIYGGMFIAACISAAFVKQDIRKIIEAGLSVIPKDCEYARMVEAVFDYYDQNKTDWKAAFDSVRRCFGYDRYPGTCHIIPNSAVIILSLLYGGGNFSDSINICNMCGWDTDCNVANVGTILGVRNGLQGIDYKWRRPINDFIVCSSVIGSLNIMDIPQTALFIAKYGYLIAGEEPPHKWKALMEQKGKRFHFELPGSTHGFRWKSGLDQEQDLKNTEVSLSHTTQEAYEGTGSLKIVVNQLPPTAPVKVYHKTYYRPRDFHDNRYEPSFSPILYPGQHIRCSLKTPENYENEMVACLYVRDGNQGIDICSEPVRLTNGNWTVLDYDIPPMEGACLEEAGIKCMAVNGFMPAPAIIYLDDFCMDGSPEYGLDFAKERMEVWTPLQREVSQFTYLKGIWNLEDGELSGSSCDFGEAYTGDVNWTDYTYEITMIPKKGFSHQINFRVQGAIRSYAAGLVEGKLVLQKNNNGYTELKSIPYQWDMDHEYKFRIKAEGPSLTVWVNGQEMMAYTDEENPYLKGQVGVSVSGGSHCHYKNFKIGKTED